jgi:hypothetical protein
VVQGVGPKFKRTVPQKKRKEGREKERRKEERGKKERKKERKKKKERKEGRKKEKLKAGPTNPFYSVLQVTRRWLQV